MDVSPRQDFLSVEMSGATASALLNQGTINLWFGRNAEKSLVSKILLTISSVDSTAEHEREVICSFEDKWVRELWIHTDFLRQEK